MQSSARAATYPLAAVAPHKKRILLIGGALNQTRIAHAIAQQLPEYEAAYSPCYMDAGLVSWLGKADLLEWTALGGAMKSASMEYINDHGLPLDDGGTNGPYDLVVTTTDLVVPKNIRANDVVLVQEGMTDPENALYKIVKRLKLPRYLASTATFGLSHRYRYMCIGSDGYKEHFINKGIRADKLVVTGLPHWDRLVKDATGDNTFPLRNYVLVATSDARETLKVDRRKRFIRRARELAGDKQLVFKLHPNENEKRARREIAQIDPTALVYMHGNINHMIAHCDMLITQYSTVVYTGLALGKECHSYFNEADLKRQMPMQNGGTSAQNMAEVCRYVLEGKLSGGRSLADVCQCRNCRTGTQRLDAAAG